jgi:hypothetical protein
MLGREAGHRIWESREAVGPCDPPREAGDLVLVKTKDSGKQPPKAKLRVEG